ncbi:MAG: YdcF family protein [Planctomycetes bacterium]|nr:YdcF family protein [Planctomycetota bacterium]
MRVRRIARGAVVWTAMFAVLIHQHLIWSAASFVSESEASPPRHTAIVLGASVRPDGSPSPMLEDRLVTAARLYELGRVEEVLVSGDGGGDGYDEVSVMRAELESLGVPAEHIRCDHLGFRTITTMIRAHDAFAVRDALVVTNPFHLHRSVFLARRFGIDAHGVAARGHRYSGGTLARHHAREVLARLFSWFEVWCVR